MHADLAALGLRYPIFQAPMAGVSTPALAAAVSRAGGLGALGLGASTAEGAKAQLSQARALGARRLHANGFCHPAPARDEGRERAWIQHFEGAFRDRDAAPPKALTPPYVPFQEDDAMVAVLLEARPEVVSFHFGLPREDQLRALRDAGILTLVSVTCAEDGQAALDAGLQVMVGCMVATSLSMAPGVLVAQGAVVVDLDGPLLLAKDREPGLLYDAAGQVHAPEAALWG